MPRDHPGLASRTLDDAIAMTRAHPAAGLGLQIWVIGGMAVDAQLAHMGGGCLDWLTSIPGDGTECVPVRHVGCA